MSERRLEAALIELVCAAREYGVELDRRVRPHGFNQLHAHRADEAPGSWLYPIAIPLTTDGTVVAEAGESTVERRSPSGGRDGAAGADA